MITVRTLPDIFAHLFHPRRSNNHRPRILHPEALFILMITIGVLFGGFKAFNYFFAAHRGILGYASNISPNQVLAATNAERAKNGLSALVYNDKLSQAAVTKANYMFAKQFWAHTAPDGTEPWFFIRQAGYSYKVAGENLARDFSDTDSMMAAWMASPTHRANIVNTRYNDIGIGVVDGTLEGYETTLVVQMFGSPNDGTAKIPATAVKTVESQPPKPVATVVPTPAPVTATQPVPPAQSATKQATPPASPVGAVLASVLVPLGSIERPPLFTPLQLTKAFFLAVIVMIVSTLAYDGVVIGHRRTSRLVGKNLGHIALFLAVAYLLIFFKGGIIG